MKKTCKNCCYFVSQGYGIKGYCKKIYRDVNINSNRAGCKYWNTRPPVLPKNEPGSFGRF